MTPRVIAIDWSGAASGAARKIWLAEVTAGRITRLEDGRSREQIAAHLLAEAARDPRLIIGFDFAFSFPAWFLREHGLADAPALWRLAAREAEGWLAACAPPFWGRPGKRRPALPADPDRFRRAERELASVAGIRPKSIFQIGGAGAVGTGSLRGLPILGQLHAAGFAIWPCTPPGWPLVVEIYPRLLTGPVTKSRATSRADYLAARFPALPGAILARAVGSEDAFDAAVSALVMGEHLADLGALPAAADPLLAREGAIWFPGWRTT